MKLTLYMAVSIDGKITRGESESDWVSESDYENFENAIKNSDAVIMGRKTMDQFIADEAFPLEDSYSIVLSRNTKLHVEGDNYVIFDATPEQVIEFSEVMDFNKLLLIGGTETNIQFLKAGLVDEIILSVHPLIIGKGLSLFGNEELNVELKLISSIVVNKELVQIKYKVRK